MSIVPKASVRYHVVVAVLVTIILSWILSTGVANYMNYLSIRSVRQEMLDHPEVFPQPIPEPRFGILDFFLGRPPRGLDRIATGPSVLRTEPRPPAAGAPPPPFPQVPGAAVPPAPPQRPPISPSTGPPLSLGPEVTGPRPLSPPAAGFFSPVEIKWVLLRVAVALGLAVLAAVWVGRKLTNPVLELTKGAQAFRSRNFSYRVPLNGESEFTAVASAMNEMADEVSRHICSLEEDARRRRRFLADIAHELRGPVTTMRTMAGALQDGVADDPERKAQAVDALVRTSERMLRLVQDVMELVERDLDRLPIKKSQTDLRSLLSGAIASFKGEAIKAGVTLEPLQSGTPVTANVDPDRIIQALDNIIGNAVSYAGKGAMVTAAIEDANPVRITIADTGVGIPAKDLPYVIDSFYRVDAARTPSEGHIGLGLSIARRLVEAHDGQLLISSEEGKGTTATILVPKGL